MVENTHFSHPPSSYNTNYKQCSRRWLPAIGVSDPNKDIMQGVDKAGQTVISPCVKPSSNSGHQ